MRSPFDWPRGPFRSADGDGLASYALNGEAPSLVLDFTGQIYAADPSGWAEPYAVGGERPTMLLDFITGEYGA